MDKKISQLFGATTPLTGTEELAIVQGGSTVKATSQDVADLAPQELPTQVVGDAGKFLQADGSGGVSYQSAGLPYLVYSAKLQQTSTNNPVATVYENTTGQSIVFTRGSSGQYSCTLVGSPFGSDNSKFFITAYISLSPPFTPTKAVYTSSSFQFIGFANFISYSTLDSSGAYSDGSEVTIEIRVYP